MTQEDKYSLLIPRYLRGELSQDELAGFEAFLSENADFKAEIEFEKSLMAARPDHSNQPSLEFGWARLSRDIDALGVEEKHPEVDLNAEAEVKTFGSFWKIAAAALACLSIGQGAYISNSKSDSTLDSKYELAYPDGKSGVEMQIGVSNVARFEEISNFLTEHNGQIISGPGKLGIYTLSFSDSDDCQSAATAFNSKEQFVDTYTSCSTNP